MRASTGRFDNFEREGKAMASSERDPNQELHKTRGLAWTNVAAARTILCNPDHVKDPEDCEIVGLFEALVIVADRLDDQCEMNERENAQACEALSRRNRIEEEEASRLRELAGGKAA